ncbi:MAG: 4Fe-4S dicluster domain-containing protein [Myxococcota bacterium]
MNAADFTTCAYCPRLCRHECPVAVATGLEASTPTAMMTAPLLAERGDFTPADALAGTSLCLGCGACTAHCKLHVPVPARLAAFRAPHLPAPAAAALAPISGTARIVCVLTGEDWSAAWSARVGAPVATLRTADELGHTAWRHGALAVPAEVARHLAGREIVTTSGAVEAVARAAGVPVTRVPPPIAPRAFVTCHDGPRTSPDQLACCGRREAFAEREPAAAHAVAEENVRRFAGRTFGCADEGCAAWLRAHGADMAGPVDGLSGSHDGR